MQNERKGYGFRRTGPRSLGNIVLEINSFDLTATPDGCYPGMVSGRVLGGALNGKNLVIAIRKTRTNDNVPKVPDFASETSMSFTEPGGTIAFENVREFGGRIFATWANKFADPSSDLRIGMPMQVSPTYDRQGNLRKFRHNNATIYGVRILHLEESQTVRTAGELRSAAFEVLEQSNSAYLAAVPEDGQSAGNFDRATCFAWRGWVNGAPAPVDTAVESLLASEAGQQVLAAVEVGKPVDIMPMESIVLGSKAAESVDQGQNSAVKMNSFRTGGLGMRLSTAIKRMDRSAESMIEGAFLRSASSAAKSAFAQKGWRGIWDRDVKRFFSMYDIDLPIVSEFGFAVSTGVVKSFGGEGAHDFLAKARALTRPVPREAIPTPSCQQALSLYYEGFSRALENISKAIPDGPSEERPDSGWPTSGWKPPQPQPGHRSKDVESALSEIDDVNLASPDDPLAI